MTLVAAGVNYEDERISFQDWPKIKPTIPGGRLPAVKITDSHGHVKWMVESLAIARYMAKKHHMMGGTEEEYYNVEKLIGQIICESLKASTGKLAVGDKVTLADLVLIAVIDHVTDLDKEFLTGKYPEIHKHRENLLASSPRLAKYLSDRAATPF
ncbi:unnamed protein product [Schistosoma margrebowiei]|uniref:glutathione transferase n=1 Tax=Schistosoma margrebowiei TaxID=48269 RepID=A0A183LG31_9TREM|nr:unnamed protein product [Schistosoma margrebowiei]